MTDSLNNDEKRVLVELADVAAWVRDAEDDPAAAFADVLPRLSGEEKDAIIANLVVLCGYAMMKPTHMTSVEYLERLITLLQRQRYPVESDE